ncbi:MAG TPA: FAD-dependent oxidoreductase, partial [Puia sp.]
NLFVPVCLSASHIAYGSIRMEPVFMMLAQSTAVAACTAIDAKETVQEINIKKLQDFLRKNPLLNGSSPEILTDNGDSAHIKVIGNWKKENSGGYVKSFLDAEPSKENKVIFTTPISKTGKYSIYAYLPNIDNSSSQINFEIFDGLNTKKLIVRIKDIKSEGQTSGEWAKLGEWALQKGNKSRVTITGENADGMIVADAVLCVPVK